MEELKPIVPSYLSASASGQSGCQMDLYNLWDHKTLFIIEMEERRLIKLRKASLFSLSVARERVAHEGSMGLRSQVPIERSYNHWPFAPRHPHRDTESIGIKRDRRVKNS